MMRRGPFVLALAAMILFAGRSGAYWGTAPSQDSEHDVDACDAPGEIGTTALMRASFAGDPGETARLLGAGAAPDRRCATDGPTALLMVLGPLFADRFASGAQLDRVPFPLRADVGSEEDLAARQRTISTLLAAGANPNANEGDTYPLTVAVMLDQVWAVELLMAWGAVPEIVPNLTQIAAMIGNEEIDGLLGLE